MASQNGIIGDANFGTDIPQSQVPEQDLTRETAMARFSTSEEFKVLKAFAESRIAHYQHYLPGGNGNDISIRDISNEERGHLWMAADTVIAEFTGLLQAYEQANEALRESHR